MCNAIQNAIYCVLIGQTDLQVHESRKRVFIIRRRSFHAS